MASFYGDNFTEDGRLFHRKGKETVTSVLFHGGDLLKLGSLIVKEAWLRDDGEGYPVNTRFLMGMREAFLNENRDALVTLSKPIQAAIEKSSQWLIVLYRNDQMYFERIGGCILFVIMKFPAYEHDLPGLLAALEEWYFESEKRADRVSHMRLVFRWVREHYATWIWFRESFNWCFRYIYEHRDAFNWQVPSEEDPDRSIYDPLVWVGGAKGRGKEWIIVNGGNG